MTKQEFIDRRNRRNHFCTDNNLIGLIDTEITEVELIKLLNTLGIKTFMCIDHTCKDEFFELSGIIIKGSHDDETNKMVFNLFTF